MHGTNGAGAVRHMAQRLGHWFRTHDEGAATAEFAVVLPAVVVMLALLLYTARACVVQLECQDAAAAVARQLVVLDGDVATARASAGAGVHVAVAGEANRYVVTTTCRVVSDPLHVIPGSVRGNAVGGETGWAGIVWPALCVRVCGVWADGSARATQAVPRWLAWRSCVRRPCCSV